MLVLQRKKDETIVIDGNIRITVVDIGNDRVKLSINAPRDISILRSELIEAADANKEAAGLDNTKTVFALNSLLKK
ncbi:MAG: carbon storage regulator [Peptostreptococcaceae bacterium]|nr:carbon storage regulator [Peptostreptococcaceae bacterium]